MLTLDFKPGETILTEGESGDTAFLIVSGSVEVSVNTDADVKILGTLAEGDVFGEMSLIDPGPRSATIRAVTPTRCVTTTYDEFIASSQDNPQRALEFMKTLTRRLRLMNKHVARLSPSTGQKVQQYLK